MDVTPDPIFQVASGFMAAKHLFIANEVGIFAHLADGPTTLPELARRTTVPYRTLRILADAMVVLGFVERHGEQYQNSPVAATFLSGQTPADLRPFLRFWNHISYPDWIHLETAIRTDQPAVAYLSGGLTEAQERKRIFSEGLEALTAGTAHALATMYDFHRHQQVLDLGGGTGSFLLAILGQHPDLQATLFETPAVATIARQRLASTPPGAQITVVEGDFFTDAIPGEHDAIIVTNVFHRCLPAQNLALLRRIRARAPADARLLLVDLWTDSSHTQPALASLMAGEFLVMSGGDVYSVEEVHGWLHESGWQPIESRTLTGPFSLIVAETVEEGV